ncbi:hypothetical protein MVEN_02485500 [Mycena venus]|uniref:Zf-C3HC-domain-containing protein n=1 Tax=Mycena venus TaxID=2733690 RepID=A0A8H6WXJ3_9AGAR|nr:hypothetical protein MVEN_02485500 [Mycena venus]
MSTATSEPSGSTSTPAAAADTNTAASRATATKRKLADAFQSLDAAVEATPGPPAKKAHTGRSLYATLAKARHIYRVFFNAQRPALVRLSPFASSATPPPPLPATAEYRPSSIPSFLTRLATFKLATYANKPPQLDAVAAAKCGWTNDGKDRLVCGLCSVSWVVAGREGMSRDAANALVEKQRVSLVEAHKNGCPWKTRQCDPSIYRIPLQAPAVMVREIKTAATVLDPIMQQIEVKHPLTSSQLASLRATVSAFALPPPAEDAPTPPDPCETAVLTALFGWAPAPPTTERTRVSSLSRPSSRAASRAGSPFPASTPPRLSRVSTLATPAASTSASADAPEEMATSTPGPPSTPPRQFLRRISSTFSLAGRDTSTTTSLLHCALCQRRVGLWAFAPPTEISPPPAPRPGVQARAQRQFDLLKEHRSYCPYVVRSTLVPSLPAEPPSASASSTANVNGSGAGAGMLEGWRAVLAVVLRYGLGQRQREARTAAALRRRISVDGVGGDTAMDVDGENGNGEDVTGGGVDKVEAMVESVKARGGKELLRYVKGLLG